MKTPKDLLFLKSGDTVYHEKLDFISKESTCNKTHSRIECLFHKGKNLKWNEARVKKNAQ